MMHKRVIRMIITCAILAGVSGCGDTARILGVNQLTAGIGAVRTMVIQEILATIFPPGPGGPDELIVTIRTETLDG